MSRVGSAVHWFGHPYLVTSCWGAGRIIRTDCRVSRCTLGSAPLLALCVVLDAFSVLRRSRAAGNLFQAGATKVLEIEHVERRRAHQAETFKVVLHRPTTDILPVLSRQPVRDRRHQQRCGRHVREHRGAGASEAIVFAVEQAHHRVRVVGARKRRSRVRVFSRTKPGAARPTRRDAPQFSIGRADQRAAA